LTDYKPIKFDMDPVVGDSTDPEGTKRPNLDPAPEKGSEYVPMPTPHFAYKIHLPDDINELDAFGIWSQFFNQTQMQNIAIWTNSYAQKYDNKKAPWIDTWLEELYAYFAILIYMALYPLNDIDLYWNTNESKPINKVVFEAMARNRFWQLRRNLQVAPPNPLPTTVFEKV
jgi:hypothetical protein